jgi:hypothetical protein
MVANSEHPTRTNWISISYSNPLYGTKLPNNLIFRFPIFRQPLPFFPARETTYVFFRRTLAMRCKQDFILKVEM